MKEPRMDAKDETTRPNYFGEEIDICSLQEADHALHELSWLTSELERHTATANQQIEKIREDLANWPVKVEGIEVTLAARIQDLQEALEAWTVQNIEPHLPKGKRSRDMDHGTLGLRQQPLVVEIAEPKPGEKALKADDVVERIFHSKFRSAKRGLMLRIKTVLDLAGAKEAFQEKKLTAEELASVGLSVREACDAPVVKVK